jgi:hypothetical protein
MYNSYLPENKMTQNPPVILQVNGRLKCLSIGMFARKTVSQTMNKAETCIMVRSQATIT